MLTRRSAILAVVAAVAVAGAGTTVKAQADVGGGLTPDQLQFANSVARFEAAGTTPTDPGIVRTLPNGAWPTNVTKVTALVIDRNQTASWVGLQTTEDDRLVVVVQLQGSFGVMTTGPKGAAPSVGGSQEVAVVDAGTGQILDFAVDASSLQLHGGTVLYSRG